MSNVTSFQRESGPAQENHNPPIEIEWRKDYRTRELLAAFELKGKRVEFTRLDLENQLGYPQNETDIYILRYVAHQIDLGLLEQLGMNGIIADEMDEQDFSEYAGCACISLGEYANSPKPLRSAVFVIPQKQFETIVNIYTNNGRIGDDASRNVNLKRLQTILETLQDETPEPDEDNDTVERKLHIELAWS